MADAADIKSNASHWVVISHRNYPIWREVKLMSKDGRVLWKAETHRYVTGSEELRTKKADTRVETIMFNFESGHELRRLRRITV